MAENRIDAVEMVRKIRDDMYEEMKDMSEEEKLAYIRRRAAEYEAQRAERRSRKSGGRSAA